MLQRMAHFEKLEPHMPPTGSANHEIRRCQILCGHSEHLEAAMAIMVGNGDYFCNLVTTDATPASRFNIPSPDSAVSHSPGYRDQ